MKFERPDPTIFKTQPIEKNVAIELQSMSLADKEYETYVKLTEWYHAWRGKCYVSFSGGKDSTLLAYLTACCFRDNGWTETPLVLWFCDTGLEYPEIREFVPWYTEWLRERFPDVNIKLEFHGLLSKTRCLAHSKKTSDDSLAVRNHRRYTHRASSFSCGECFLLQWLQ